MPIIIFIVVRRCNHLKTTYLNNKQHEEVPEEDVVNDSLVHGHGKIETFDQESIIH